jgi:predicted DNA-binding transcriptional regulator AlpA
MNPAINVPEQFSRSDRLLYKWTGEERTSLHITTIYRRMNTGTFPKPVSVGRVARIGHRCVAGLNWEHGCAVRDQGLDADASESGGSAVVRWELEQALVEAFGLRPAKVDFCANPVRFGP